MSRQARFAGRRFHLAGPKMHRAANQPCFNSAETSAVRRETRDSRRGVTSMMSIKLPLWLRFFLIIGVAVFAAGAGLVACRYYARPATLTVPVGSIDCAAGTAMSGVAGV